MLQLKRYFSKYYLPRWLVLLFDLTVPIISWFIAYLLRFNFDLSVVETALNPLHITLILPAFVFCYWKFKSYSGVLRHSNTKDIFRIISSVICAGILLTGISLTGSLINTPDFMKLSVSVIIIFVMLVITILIFSRLFAKLLFQHWLTDNKKSKKVMIYGAGKLGQITLKAILMDTSENLKVVGFIDDNDSLQDKYISGVPVFSVKRAFDRFIYDNKVTEIIFAIDNAKITNKRKREIADMCIDSHIMVKEVPSVKNWINDELKIKSIQPIKIEDLLGRNSIQLDRDKIREGLKDSVVLVTGAAGSIGSEIVRQLIEFNVKKVILLDKAESDLFNLQNEILSKKIYTEIAVIVGDVTNAIRVRKIFMEYSPSIVFNAAAYKHVPLMEDFPHEAFRVNVGGTKILADLSIEFGVEKFVFISTDKAVNPTNVMGTTKRISEMYIQSLVQSQKVSTQFIITRFGNVLGSNGSVVPLFKKQIENGGPITITHKDITRYFMTIPEACQLVLEAGFMGKGGEIFVFDMGEPVRIYDLATKMISLSGFVPNKDIEIKIVGLRPGEKLYEELLGEKEELQPTYNDKIMIGKIGKYDLSIVNEITDLLINVDELSKDELVEHMKRIVPEFHPSNVHYVNGESKKHSPDIPTLKIAHNRLEQKRRAIS